MVKAGMVLEGGATRGVFTAGVLDFLMEKDLYFKYVIGVSAGACNAVDYVAKQIGRTRQCMIIEDKENAYVDFRRTMKTGSVFDMDMIFDKFPNEIFPFDYDTCLSSKIKWEVVATNCETGKAEYFTEQEDKARLMQVCRASSSLPLLAPMVMVDGVPYLDGGLADSVPVSHALRKGYKKCVVVLTRRKGYRKVHSKNLDKLYIAALRKYPNLINSIVHRPEVYNKQMDLIDRLEQEGRIFVIRPRMQEVSRTEQNVQVLTEFYQHGYDTMEEQYVNMLEYLVR
ncbi:MAG: patatin family protein [Lachnospiraceae bacterium]|nr:patatin family protein [Lachnospiraceae bacterium]